MPSALGKSLLREAGLVDGDGVRDSTVYLQDHCLVVDVRGRDAGKPALLIRGLGANNAPITIAQINKDSTVQVGQTASADRAVYLSGAYTGDAETVGLGVDYTLTPTAGVGTGQGGDAAQIKINGTMNMAPGPGFNGILAALRVETTFVGIAGGHQLGMYLLNLRSFVVPSVGTIDVAATLTVDSPSGPAGALYSIMNSGTVQMRGASSFSFEQVNLVRDSLIGGSTGAGVYIVGSALGDLCIRSETGKKILLSGDGGTLHVQIDANGFNVPGAAAPVLRTLAAITSGAAAQTATLTNSPVAGNPTKWFPINDAGVVRWCPAW